MSLIGSTLAFLGVAAAVSPRKADDEAERIRQIEHWADYLEEALGSERRLCAHWKEEARRLAVDNSALRMQALQQAPAQAAMNGSYAYQQLGAQQAQSLQNPLSGFNPLGALCNCVPARMDGLIGRLNSE